MEGRRTSHRTKSGRMPNRPREEFLTSLRRGSSLLKFGRTGNPHFTFVRLSDDESELMWRSEMVGRMRKFRSVPLTSVRRIVPGQTTATFQRNPHPSLAGLSFSLIYDKKGRERSLDLVCKTDHEYEIWLHGLQAFVSLQRERVRLSGADLGSEDSSSTLAVSTPTSDGSGDSEGTEVTSATPRQLQALCDLYVWGGCEADLAPPVDGWQQSRAPVFVNDSARLNIQQASVSSGHAIALTRQGNVYTWGSGVTGQLGHGSTQDYAQPQLVEELRERGRIQLVDCSDNVSLAVSVDGAVYSWGDGKMSGVLGLGGAINRQWTPRRIEHGLGAIRIASVSAGPFHCAAVSHHGGLYTWGDGFGGRLGHGTCESRHSPAFVDYFNDMRVVGVSCGFSHTAAVAQPRAGPPSSSEAGFAEAARAHASVFRRRSLPEVPRDISWGPGRAQPHRERGPQLSLCASHAANGANSPSGSGGAAGHTGSGLAGNSAADTEAPQRRGSIYTWGANDCRCLGHGQERVAELLPGEVGGGLLGLDAVQVSCGCDLTVAVTACGRVFQWGSMGEPVSEPAPWTESREPEQVLGELEAWHVESVACGNHHCLALARSSGDLHCPRLSRAVFAWGRRVEGQLGVDRKGDSGIPVKVEAFKDLEVFNVVAGANHSMAVCGNNLAMTEAAAMEDAKRLKPLLLGARPREQRANLSIEIPTGYTTGGPASTTARDSAVTQRQSRSGSLALFHGASSPAAMAAQAAARHSQTGSLGSLMRVARAAKAAQRTAAKGRMSFAARGSLATQISLQRGGLRSPLTPSRQSRYQQPAEPSTSHDTGSHTHSAGASSSPSTADSRFRSSPPEARDHYVSELEAKVSSLKTKVRDLEALLAQHGRAEGSNGANGGDGAEAPGSNSGTRMMPPTPFPEPSAFPAPPSLESEANMRQAAALEKPANAAERETAPRFPRAAEPSDFPETMARASTLADGLECSDESKQIRLLKDENRWLRAALNEALARTDNKSALAAPSKVRGGRDERAAPAVSNGEWTEMVQPGVFVTLFSNPSGDTELKGVKFSSRLFSKGQAELWWKENREKVAEQFLYQAVSSPPLSVAPSTSAPRGSSAQVSNRSSWDGSIGFESLNLGNGSPPGPKAVLSRVVEPSSDDTNHFRS